MNPWSVRSDCDGPTSPAHLHPEFKAEVALGVRTGTTPATEACRTHQPRPTLLAVWKATFRERLPVVFRPMSRGSPRRPGWPTWSDWSV
jgi:transposase-like protein